MNQNFLLGLLLILYCCLHSLLISLPITAYFKRILRNKFSWYRMVFNIFSVITLFPILYFAYSIKNENIFSWSGNLIFIQFTLIITGIYTIYAGSKGYSFEQFSGIRQIRTHSLNENDIISENLSTSGILSFIRHPWYTGVIILLWSRNLNNSTLIVNIVFTLYFFVGAYWEEKKLILAFGENYINYKKKVSMFFPLKWFMNKLKKPNQNK